MGRPKHALTEQALTAPAKTRALVLDALEEAHFDYAVAAAMLGVSDRQLRVICQSFGLTNAVMVFRQQAGRDRRGRPRKEPPSKAVLQRAMEVSKGSINSAARALGVSPPTLKAWLKVA